MPASYFGLVAALIAFAASAQSSIAPKSVEIKSGTLRLKGYLWVPSGSGPFPAVLYDHGRSDSAQYHWRAGNLTLSAAADARTWPSCLISGAVEYPENYSIYVDGKQYGMWETP